MHKLPMCIKDIQLGFEGKEKERSMGRTLGFVGKEDAGHEKVTSV